MYKNLKQQITVFSKNESGATSIEYAAIASLVSIVIILTVNSIGNKVGVLFLQKLANMM